MALNGLSYATYLVISKQLVSRYRPLVVIAWVYIFALPNQQKHGPGHRDKDASSPRQAEALLSNGGGNGEGEDGDERHHQPGVHRCRSCEADQEQSLVQSDPEQAAYDKPWDVARIRQRPSAVGAESESAEDQRAATDPPAPDPQRREPPRQEGERPKDRE
jgi:hypothetical protein